MSLKRKQRRGHITLSSILSFISSVLGLGALGALLVLCLCVLWPQPTIELSRHFSHAEQTAFSKEQLESLANATRDYAFGSHNLESLEAVIAGINKAAYDADPQSFFSYIQSAAADAAGNFKAGPKVGPDAIRAVPLDELDKKPEQGRSASKSDSKRFEKEQIKVLPSIDKKQDGVPSFSIPQSDGYTYLEPVISHLNDVYELYIKILVALILLSILGLVAIITRIRSYGIASLGRSLIVCAGLIIVACISLVISVALGFNSFFIGLHELLFPQGNFLFSANSLLISTFPERFWFTMALIFLGAYIIYALICFIIGRLLLRIH